MPTNAISIDKTDHSKSITESLGRAGLASSEDAERIEKRDRENRAATEKVHAVWKKWFSKQQAMNPVVIVDETPLEPDWAICDMFFDLHCGARPPETVAPGTEYTWRYRIVYMDAAESAPYVEKARWIPLTAEDYRRYHYPCLSLGRNDFSEHVRIDEADDSSGFRPDPPLRVWDRQAGPEGKGALRIAHDLPRETVWTAEPPSLIPASRKLMFRALARTLDVSGKGFFLRVRVSRWVWYPEPHAEYREKVQTVPLTGTTDWVPVETPVLTFEEDDPDACVWIELVLDGSGTGWLTDLDVNMQGIEEEVPVAPKAPVRPVFTPACPP